jgi:hypothetical protein
VCHQRHAARLDEPPQPADVLAPFGGDDATVHSGQGEGQGLALQRPWIVGDERRTEGGLGADPFGQGVDPALLVQLEPFRIRDRGGQGRSEVIEGLVVRGTTGGAVPAGRGGAIGRLPGNRVEVQRELQAPGLARPARRGAPAAGPSADPCRGNARIHRPDRLDRLLGRFAA